MPLDRAHVPPGLWLLIRAYPVLNGIFGVVFVLDVQHRLAVAPAMAPVRAMLPIWGWGIMWLTLTAVLVVTIVQHDRDRFIWAVTFNGFVWLAWGLLVESAIFTEPLVTPLAGVLPVFVGWSCRACAKTLRREGDR